MELHKNAAQRLLVALLLSLVIGYIGYLAIALGPRFWSLTLAAWLAGEERIVEPAEIRGGALRSGDRLYLLTVQQERVVPIRATSRSPRIGRPRHYLHVDLWAFDARTARPAWTKRVRTFEDGGAIDYALLGLDGGTLWLFVREPLAVAIADGTIVADGARLDRETPALAGKRVDRTGWVAFGGQGLQLTLSDATQWVVAGETFTAMPRETAPRDRTGLVVPRGPASSTDDFQLRGIMFGETRWLGVLTDDEAAKWSNDPVVPGAKPGERRGAMYDFLASQHVPDRLTPQLRPYRLWGAKVTKVSAAPRDWPKELPNTWGTRDQFGDYAVLPEAPAFLQAGLLGNGVDEQAMWFRDPDSVVVLFHDEVGPEARVRVARVAGPAGRVVWDAALDLAVVEGAFYGPTALAFVGSVPNPAHDPDSEVSRAEHERIVGVDVATGTVASFDLTAESARPAAGDAAPDR